MRNGGPTLRRAIDSVLGQTYRRLEIIISDNCSSDETAAVCREALARDSRIRVFSQARALSGVENFRFVYEQATGDYFMWAAHDDMRTLNYVEVLVDRLGQDPTASLAFSEAVSCPEPDLGFSYPLDPFFCDLETTGLSFRDKLRKQATRGCVHVYGLLRSAHLRGYPWYDVERSPDRPLLYWLLVNGDFVRADGARFFYYNPGKTLEQSAAEHFFYGLQPLSRERTTWASAEAIRRALWTKRRRWLPTSLLFAALYLWEARGWRNAMYPWTPRLLRSIWRSLKPWFQGRVKREVRSGPPE